MIYENRMLSGIFARSPIVLQNVMASGFGLLKVVERRSAVYQRMLEWLAGTEWRSQAELDALQDEGVAALAQHAYDNVPYYRRVFDERHLRPEDVRTVRDLWKLPVLTKADVRQHYTELQARNVPDQGTVLGRTGGTTGVPLQFRLDRERVVFDHVLIHRHWSWAGWKPGSRTVLVRGFTLISSRQHRPPFWRSDWIDRRIYLSGFHMSESALPAYLDALESWAPCYLAGYPSCLFTIARYMQQQRRVIPMRAIFTSSELLTDTERRVIEQAFACRVWDRYGTGERLVVFQQCEHAMYHQNVEFGVAEVEVDGRPGRPGEAGQLLQTGLTNWAMPLIRYDIGDSVRVSDGVCACGRGLAVIGIVDGRRDEALVTSEGRIMPRAGLDQIYEYVSAIERCQLFQERVGEIVVRVIPRPEFGKSDEEEIVRQLRKRVGNATALRVVVAKDIPKSPTGKTRFIVSRVDPDGNTRSQSAESPTPTVLSQ